ncbi:MAG TPA: hypothetical protein VGI03_16185 [Verrucomicrobiae bacterium]|jgi:hypothetical protein
MNTIRAKIIVSWLLFLIWGSLIYLHHLLIAWCIFGLALLIRNTKPKTSQVPQRTGYFLSFGFIAILVLVLTAGIYSFPPNIVTIGKILAELILWPILFYSAYLDYKAFKTHDTRA